MSEALQIKIELMDMHYKVKRELLIPTDYTLLGLHCVLQTIFEWENTHLFSFELGAKNAKSRGWELIEAENYENDLVTKYLNSETKLRYIYDFGDDWGHDIKFVKILPKEISYPICLKGEGVGPEEDSGGASGFCYMMDVIKDPSHSEYEDVRDWLGLEEGEEYVQPVFDLQNLNEVLAYNFADGYPEDMIDLFHEMQEYLQ